MKDRIDAILRRNQAEYLESLLPPRDALLEQMEKFAEENDHPIADPEVAQLMRALVRMKRPRRVLEVGTNIGYSVIVIGRECDRGGGGGDDRDRSQHASTARASSPRRRCRAAWSFMRARRWMCCRGSPARSTSSSSIA